MAQLYDSLRWATARTAALARDANECQARRLFGGECSALLHVHHIRRPEHGGAMYALDNLVTVCASHHPQLEAVRRYLDRKHAWKRCPHEHRTLAGREACEAKLNRRDLSRTG